MTGPSGTSAGGVRGAGARVGGESCSRGQVAGTADKEQPQPQGACEARSTRAAICRLKARSSEGGNWRLLGPIQRGAPWGSPPVLQPQTPSALVPCAPPRCRPLPTTGQQTPGIPGLRGERPVLPGRSGGRRATRETLTCGDSFVGVGLPWSHMKAGHTLARSPPGTGREVEGNPHMPAVLGGMNLVSFSRCP